MRQGRARKPTKASTPRLRRSRSSLARYRAVGWFSDFTPALTGYQRPRRIHLALSAAPLDSGDNPMPRPCATTRTLIILFPPPEVGKPTGQLSTRTNWYLCDDGCRYRDPEFDWRAAGEESIRREQFNKRVGQCIKEARLQGARPMGLLTLLEWSGQSARFDPP